MKEKYIERLSKRQKSSLRAILNRFEMHDIPEDVDYCVEISIGYFRRRAKMPERININMEHAFIRHGYTTYDSVCLRLKESGLGSGNHIMWARLWMFAKIAIRYDLQCYPLYMITRNRLDRDYSAEECLLLAEEKLGLW